MRRHRIRSSVGCLSAATMAIAGIASTVGCTAGAPAPTAALAGVAVTPAEGIFRASTPSSDTLPQPIVLWLSLDIAGQPTEVLAHVYKPPGDGPFPLVIYAHGRSPSQLERLQLAWPILPGHARYWLRKGIAVVAPIRPGYGDTGGSDREDPHSAWRNGRCTAQPDYAGVADRARATVVATWTWATAQPWVRKDRVLLEGQSTGGLTSLAAAALDLAGVVGVVNFAGGAGGAPDTAPGRSCKPQALAQVFAAYGAQTHVPSLWLYAENDLYWGSEAPRRWFEAYGRGGDNDARLVQTGPLEGHDGHQLLRYGGNAWTAPLDAFVEHTGLLRP